MNGNQENLKIDPERGVSSPENIVEKQSNTIEKIDIKIDKHEATPELSTNDVESNTEKARAEALENAKKSELNNYDKKEIEKVEKKSVSHKRGSVNKKQREKSYKQTMQHVQNELPPNSRAFSKIIHNKTIEKTSDIVGNTIARPNAILAGAFVAFLFTLVTYTIAKTIGYALSGFETIAAFIVGWIVGVIYDYFRVLFTGGKS